MVSSKNVFTVPGAVNKNAKNGVGIGLLIIVIAVIDRMTHANCVPYLECPFSEGYVTVFPLSIPFLGWRHFVIGIIRLENGQRSKRDRDLNNKTSLRLVSKGHAVKSTHRSVIKKREMLAVKRCHVCASIRRA
ncbi:hypothetical protein ACLEEB_12005 [Lonsdalea quercina]|uniref:hypothetical protein n=1 Tax=Lonsdalea quercina TaxID=71657 RepID=UPI0011138A3C|nr:hypothetical protein [Lonsdalea quercina]